MTVALIGAACFLAGFVLGLLVGAYRWRSGGRHRGRSSMRG